MKNKRTEIISYIFCLIAGVLLTIFSSRGDELLRWVISLMGIMFVVPSLITIIILCLPPKDPTAGRQWFSVVPGAAGLLLGILMLSKPELFVNMLAWFFAILLILIGVYQIAVEISAEREFGTSKLLLIVPILVTVVGIVIICMGPESIVHLAAIVTGIALLVYSINGIVGLMHLQSRKRRAEAQQSESEDASTHEQKRIEKKYNKPEYKEDTAKA